MNVAGKTLRVVQLKLRLERALDVIGADIRAALQRRVQQIALVDAAGKGDGRLGVLAEKFFQIHRSSTSVWQK